MPRMRRTAAGDTVKPAWQLWRVGLVVAALSVGVFLADELGVGLFGVVPIVFWCAMPVRAPQTGWLVGLVLLVLLVWFVVPRGLGWSGRWVPSADEVLWLLPVLAVVVCRVGLRVARDRPAGVGRLWMVVVVGFLVTGFVLLTRLEAPPGDEGVLPVPDGLEVVEDVPVCGSGGCAREVSVTGDHALPMMRAHLAARGYVPWPRSWMGGERMCRVTGLVVVHRTCAVFSAATVSTVRVLWNVE